jgi:hypothetical protein
MMNKMCQRMTKVKMWFPLISMIEIVPKFKRRAPLLMEKLLRLP